MRTLVIGDIHGHSDPLKRLLDTVQLGQDDCLITLGDYVDRGPDSRGVLDVIIELKRRKNTVALFGNHEQMMLDARDSNLSLVSWMSCGGLQTLTSYGANPNEHNPLRRVPDAHWHFLEKGCVDYFETSTHFFVHAQVDPDLPLDAQPPYLLRWEALHHAVPHSSGKIMVCGHTKQLSGLPRNWGHAICIDTWVYGDGWLTCLEIETGRIWQTNRLGELRQDYLPEPEENGFS